MTGETLANSGPGPQPGAAGRGLWRAVGIAVSVLLVAAQLYCMASPLEAWPFTSAPMFARYQARRAPLYYIRWWVEQAGTRRPLVPKVDLGIGELPFRRGYFSAYYGSTDAAHPGGHFPDDGEAAFLARQSEYCARLRGAWSRRWQAPAPDFALTVVERTAGAESGSRLMGRCGPDGFRRAE